MIAIQDETDLLPAVYDGPFEQPMWSTFLDRLRQRTRADYAGIFFRRPDRPLTQTVELYSGQGTMPGLRQVFGDADYLADPLPDFELREERVYALHELVDPARKAHQALGQSLRAGAGTDVRILRVAEPGGLSAWLSLTRTGQELTPSDAALLSKVAPHFRRALRTYAEIERERAGTRIAAEVLERLNFGWVGLDPRGIVVDMSEAAAKLLQHGAGLKRTQSGRLIARDPLVDRRLSAAIRSVGAGEGGSARALNISQDPWVDLLLVPASSASAASPSQAAMIAYIQGDNRSLSDRHEQIAELFGLLPSEARFALLLGRGLSIREAGETLGLTIETARNYSKKIYAKTGARGQADLVRFLLTSVLSIA